jgi:hypothetical protein
MVSAITQSPIAEFESRDPSDKWQAVLGKVGA